MRDKLIDTIASIDVGIIGHYVTPEGIAESREVERVELGREIAEKIVAAITPLLERATVGCSYCGYVHSDVVPCMALEAR